jgi:peroxiredoxin
MKKAILTFMMVLSALLLASAGVKPGDDAIKFSLKNVDGTTVELSDYNDQKGVILVFTCNPCPYANAYEQRIIKLHETYAEQGRNQ